MVKQIEKRIAKSDELNEQATEIMLKTMEIGAADKVKKMLREDTTTAILAELLNSLKNGESLQEAIETIAENY